MLKSRVIILTTHTHTHTYPLSLSLHTHTHTHKHTRGRARTRPTVNENYPQSNQTLIPFKVPRTGVASFLGLLRSRQLVHETDASRAGVRHAHRAGVAGTHGARARVLVFTASGAPTVTHFATCRKYIYTVLIQGSNWYSQPLGPRSSHTLPPAGNTTLIHGSWYSQPLGPDRHTLTLRASLSGTLNQMDVVNQCLEFVTHFVTCRKCHVN